MRAARRMAVNSFGRFRVTPEQFVVEPQVWANIDYLTVEEPDVSGTVIWKAKRQATAHGLSLWFEAEVAEGVSFSTGPDAPETVWGEAFLTFQEPVEVAKGDSISVTLQADLVVDDYLWRWATRVVSADSPGAIKADYKQSTFYSEPLSISQLRKQSDSYLPQLNEQGRIDQFILGLMTGEVTQGEIGRQVQEQFPQHFANWKQALTYIGELSKRYSL